MELFHLHSLNNHDNLYKKGKEFIVNNNYNNRLYNIVMNSTSSIGVNNYEYFVNIFNTLLQLNNISTFDKSIPICELLSIINDDNLKDSVSLSMFKKCEKKLLTDLEKMTRDYMLFIREQALENYRKDNNLQVPSRLHTLYATTENNVSYWINKISGKNIDVYKIEVNDDTFVTNENLLPDVNSTYISSYHQASRYFNPRLKDLNNINNEYLVQGKVKILEKVDEIRK